MNRKNLEQYLKDSLVEEYIKKKLKLKNLNIDPVSLFIEDRSEEYIEQKIHVTKEQKEFLFWVITNFDKLKDEILEELEYNKKLLKILLSELCSNSRLRILRKDDFNACNEELLNMSINFTLQQVM